MEQATEETVTPGPDDNETSGEDAVRCDFCGRETTSVRRVALDGDYERLRTRHQAQYACAECSADKERARQEAEREAS